METNVVFDTHAYVKSMTDAGAQPRLAEAIAQGQIAYLNATAATKTDIANIQRDIERSKNDLIKWFTHTLLVFAGIIMAGMAALLQIFLNSPSP